MDIDFRRFENVSDGWVFIFHPSTWFYFLWRGRYFMIICWIYSPLTVHLWPLLACTRVNSIPIYNTCKRIGPQEFRGHFTRLFFVYEFGYGFNFQKNNRIGSLRFYSLVKSNQIDHIYICLYYFKGKGLLVDNLKRKVLRLWRAVGMSLS